MKIKSLFSLLFAMCMLVAPYAVFAQGDPGPDPDEKIPFDGGLSLLIAAGIGYGAKKAYDKRKKSRDAAYTDEGNL